MPTPPSTVSEPWVVPIQNAHLLFVEAMLQDWMDQCTESEPLFDQLRSFIDVSNLFYPLFHILTSKQPVRMVDHTEIAEQQAGRTLVLIHHRADAATPPEELVLRVQGFLVDTSLPPLRRDQCVLWLIN